MSAVTTTVSWQSINARFKRIYNDDFMKENEISMVDIVGETVDGVKDAWIELFALDAVITRVMSKELPSSALSIALSNRPLNKTFDQHASLLRCVLESIVSSEFNMETDNVASENITKVKHCNTPRVDAVSGEVVDTWTFYRLTEIDPVWQTISALRLALQSISPASDRDEVSHAKRLEMLSQLSNCELLSGDQTLGDVLLRYVVDVLQSNQNNIVPALSVQSAEEPSQVATETDNIVTVNSDPEQSNGDEEEDDETSSNSDCSSSDSDNSSDASVPVKKARKNTPKKASPRSAPATASKPTKSPAAKVKLTSVSARKSPVAQTLNPLQKIQVAKLQYVQQLSQPEHVDTESSLPETAPSQTDSLTASREVGDMESVDKMEDQQMDENEDDSSPVTVEEVQVLSRGGRSTRNASVSYTATKSRGHKSTTDAAKDRRRTTGGESRSKQAEFSDAMDTEEAFRELANPLTKLPSSQYKYSKNLGFEVFPSATSLSANKTTVTSSTLSSSAGGGSYLNTNVANPFSTIQAMSTFPYGFDALITANPPTTGSSNNNSTLTSSTGGQHNSGSQGTGTNTSDQSDNVPQVPLSVGHSSSSSSNTSGSSSSSHHHAPPSTFPVETPSAIRTPVLLFPPNVAGSTTTSSYAYQTVPGSITSPRPALPSTTNSSEVPFVATSQVVDFSGMDSVTAAALRQIHPPGAAVGPPLGLSPAGVSVSGSIYPAGPSFNSLNNAANSGNLWMSSPPLQSQPSVVKTIPLWQQHVQQQAQLSSFSGLKSAISSNIIAAPYNPPPPPFNPLQSLGAFPAHLSSLEGRNTPVAANATPVTTHLPYQPQTQAQLQLMAQNQHMQSQQMHSAQAHLAHMQREHLTKGWSSQLGAGPTGGLYGGGSGPNRNTASSLATLQNLNFSLPPPPPPTSFNIHAVLPSGNPAETAFSSHPYTMQPHYSALTPLQQFQQSAISDQQLQLTTQEKIRKLNEATGTRERPAHLTHSSLTSPVRAVLAPPLSLNNDSNSKRRRTVEEVRLEEENTKKMRLLLSAAESSTVRVNHPAPLKTSQSAWPTHHQSHQSSPRVSNSNINDMDPLAALASIAGGMLEQHDDEEDEEVDRVMDREETYSPDYDDNYNDNNEGYDEQHEQQQRSSRKGTSSSKIAAADRRYRQSLSTLRGEDSEEEEDDGQSSDASEDYHAKYLKLQQQLSPPKPAKKKSRTLAERTAFVAAGGVVGPRGRPRKVPLSVSDAAAEAQLKAKKAADNLAMAAAVRKLLEKGGSTADGLAGQSAGRSTRLPRSKHYNADDPFVYYDKNHLHPNPKGGVGIASGRREEQLELASKRKNKFSKAHVENILSSHPEETLAARVEAASSVTARQRAHDLLINRPTHNFPITAMAVPDTTACLQLRPGLTKGEWCLPGSVVGFYADGVGHPSLSALVIGVVLDNYAEALSKRDLAAMATEELESAAMLMSTRNVPSADNEDTLPTAHTPTLRSSSIVSEESDRDSPAPHVTLTSIGSLLSIPFQVPAVASDLLLSSGKSAPSTPAAAALSAANSPSGLIQSLDTDVPEASESLKVSFTATAIVRPRLNKRVSVSRKINTSNDPSAVDSGSGHSSDSSYYEDDEEESEAARERRRRRRSSRGVAAKLAEDAMDSGEADEDESKVELIEAVTEEDVGIDVFPTNTMQIDEELPLTPSARSSDALDLDSKEGLLQLVRVAVANQQERKKSSACEDLEKEEDPIPILVVDLASGGGIECVESEKCDDVAIPSKHARKSSIGQSAPRRVTVDRSDFHDSSSSSSDEEEDVDRGSRSRDTRRDSVDILATLDESAEEEDEESDGEEGIASGTPSRRTVYTHESLAAMKLSSPAPKRSSYVSSDAASGKRKRGRPVTSGSSKHQQAAAVADSSEEDKKRVDNELVVRDVMTDLLVAVDGLCDKSTNSDEGNRISSPQTSNNSNRFNSNDNNLLISFSGEIAVLLSEPADLLSFQNGSADDFVCVDREGQVRLLNGILPSGGDHSSVEMYNPENFTIVGLAKRGGTSFVKRPSESENGSDTAISEPVAHFVRLNGGTSYKIDFRSAPTITTDRFSRSHWVREQLGDVSARFVGHSRQSAVNDTYSYTNVDGVASAVGREGGCSSSSSTYHNSNQSDVSLAAVNGVRVVMSSQITNHALWTSYHAMLTQMESKIQREYLELAGQHEHQLMVLQKQRETLDQQARLIDELMNHDRISAIEEVTTPPASSFTASTSSSSSGRLSSGGNKSNRNISSSAAKSNGRNSSSGVTSIEIASVPVPAVSSASVEEREEEEVAEIALFIEDTVSQTPGKALSNKSSSRSESNCNKKKARKSSGVTFGADQVREIEASEHDVVEEVQKTPPSTPHSSQKKQRRSADSDVMLAISEAFTQQTSSSRKPPAPRVSPQKVESEDSSDSSSSSSSEEEVEPVSTRSNKSTPAKKQSPSTASDALASAKTRRAARELMNLLSNASPSDRSRQKREEQAKQDKRAAQRNKRSDVPVVDHLSVRKDGTPSKVQRNSSGRFGSASSSSKAVDTVANKVSKDNESSAVEQKRGREFRDKDSSKSKTESRIPRPVVSSSSSTSATKTIVAIENSSNTVTSQPSAAEMARLNVEALKLAFGVKPSNLSRKRQLEKEEAERLAAKKTFAANRVAASAKNVEIAPSNIAKSSSSSSSSSFNQTSGKDSRNELSTGKDDKAPVKSAPAVVVPREPSIAELNLAALKLALGGGKGKPRANKETTLLKSTNESSNSSSGSGGNKSQQLVTAAKKDTTMTDKLSGSDLHRQLAQLMPRMGGKFVSKSAALESTVSSKPTEPTSSKSAASKIPKPSTTSGSSSRTTSTTSDNKKRSRSASESSSSSSSSSDNPQISSHSATPSKAAPSSRFSKELASLLAESLAAPPESASKSRPRGNSVVDVSSSGRIRSTIVALNIGNTASKTYGASDDVAIPTTTSTLKTASVSSASNHPKAESKTVVPPVAAVKRQVAGVAPPEMLLSHIGKKMSFPSALPVPVKKAAASSSSSSATVTASKSTNAKKAVVEAPPPAPHSGKRPETTSATKNLEHKNHSLRQFTQTNAMSTPKEGGEPKQVRARRCHLCKKHSAHFCIQCSDEAHDVFVAVCNPFSEHKHKCYYTHIKLAGKGGGK